jgi:serine/threonine-protein phosphatase 2A regulatory subunit B''
MLAFYHKKAEASLNYFWKILDVQKKGFITVWTINFFAREVISRLLKYGMNIKIEDLRDEIFDMVKPKNDTDITYDDLRRSKMGDTVVSVLIDVHGLSAYENREGSR